jgi:hypothetical protein
MTYLLTIKNYMIKFVSFVTQLEMIAVLSLWSAAYEFALKYVFSDFSYLKGIFIIIFLDAVSGVVLAIKEHRFDMVVFFKNSLLKATAYAIFLASVSVVIKLEIGGKTTEWVQFLDDYLFMGIALVELWSIVQNINRILPRKLPAWITALFQNAAETGRFKQPEKDQ